MSTKPKATSLKALDEPNANLLTKPSREVQRLLKIAGPDQPEISDLENLGSRRTRGGRARTRSESADITIAGRTTSTKLRFSTDLLSFPGLGRYASEEEDDPKERKMAKKSSKRSQRDEENRTAKDVETYKIRCICGAREEGNDQNEAWIQCDDCRNWQHNVCVGISIISIEMPERYSCQDCDPNAHQELLNGMDQGRRPWEERRKKYEEDLDTEKGSSKKRKVIDDDSGIMQQKEQIPELLAVESESKLYPLTEECIHYEHVSEVPWDIQKYFGQRYSIFSRYDDGIYMTDDAWFGVTPEPVALEISDDLTIQTSTTKRILIDLFAGAGGNSIAFALSDRWDKIIAIEKNPSVIACAQHNAAIYGVSEKITWINDDCFSYLSAHISSIDPSQTVIFASPPWGGPGYRDDEVFNLSTMQPYSIKQIHDACKNMDSALFLPRTSDLRQIARLAPEGKKVEVVQYCMVGASKGLVAYIPACSEEHRN